MAITRSHRQVRVHDGSVRYLVVGDGPPVVLIHGISGSTRWWRPIVPDLAARYRVYLVELPGFGRMFRRAPLLRLEQSASWLLSWMQAVGLEKAHVAGHSMGGYIAIRLAASTPAAVDRLILVAPAGAPTGRTLPQYAVPLLRAVRQVSPTLLPLMFLDAVRAGPLTLWRAGADLLQQDVRQYLRSIAAPTLLVWGERDALVPSSLGGLLRQEIPRARLLVLPGAGHVVMFDSPAEFTRAVLDFLDAKEVGH